MKTELTARRLREILHYDPLTGIFRWLEARSQKAIGSIAGYSDHRGYIRISVDGRRYLAHRLAWLYMTGEWPSGLLDHRDLDAGNNRFVNIREANAAQNNANKPVQADNTVGFKGVHFHHKRNLKRPYQVRLKIAGRMVSFGYFATAEEAHAVYVEQASRIYGDFARAA